MVRPRAARAVLGRWGEGVYLVHQEKEWCAGAQLAAKSGAAPRCERRNPPSIVRAKRVVRGIEPKFQLILKLKDMGFAMRWKLF